MDAWGCLGFGLAAMAGALRFLLFSTGMSAALWMFSKIACVACTRSASLHWMSMKYTPLSVDLLAVKKVHSCQAILIDQEPFAFPPAQRWPSFPSLQAKLQVIWKWLCNAYIRCSAPTCLKMLFDKTKGWLDASLMPVSIKNGFPYIVTVPDGLNWLGVKASRRFQVSQRGSAICFIFEKTTDHWTDSVPNMGSLGTGHPLKKRRFFKSTSM